jgi:hypothetical protein
MAVDANMLITATGNGTLAENELVTQQTIYPTNLKAAERKWNDAVPSGEPKIVSENQSTCGPSWRS